ncbi:MAG: substrate-binding domain-containing protein [Abditibacteriota bacterium]|nr:substrate-binding domain-containing protein [Abditibacteriota bacterium]
MEFLKKGGAQKILALAALVILWGFFAIFGNNFTSSATGLNILAASYYVGFLALGVTFVIITGGIDLSIGAVMMCSALIGGQCYRNGHVSLALCIFIIIAVGTLFGYINGLLVTKMKLPPFIATLGTMMVALGLGSIATNTTSIYYPTIADSDAWFIKLFSKNGNFPSGAVFLLVFYILAMLILNRTKIGRYIYAIGSNEEATRLSGINVDLYKTLAYVIGGFFAGLGAIFYAATYTVVIPNTGNGIELLAIAGVVIGGTSLSGGVGSLSGTIIGVFIMSVLKNGLVSMGLPAPYQTFFTGIVVICAVLLDIYRNKEKVGKKSNLWKWIIGIIILAIVACGVYFGVSKTSSSKVATTVNKDIYISVIAKGFQHQFWQTVKKGADQAAKDLGVKIYFLGPEGESAQASQIDMINQELAKSPDAICLAPLNIDSVVSQVKEANSNNIPVIIYDSGIPTLPEGKLQGTASTDNEKAAGIGAEHMFDAINDKVLKATSANQVVIAILSQDVTSASIQSRTKGFAEKMFELCTQAGKTPVITGQYADINKGDVKGAEIVIKVFVSSSPDIADVTNASNGVLNTNNLIGLFCSNEGAVNGFLASLNAGTKVPEGVQVVGYDAGSGQKAAVRSGQLLGAVSQDPFQEGYQAVKLAKEAIDGKVGQNVDTGAKWYDKTNIDDPDIAPLLYD